MPIYLDCKATGNTGFAPGEGLQKRISSYKSVGWTTSQCYKLSYLYPFLVASEPPTNNQPQIVSPVELPTGISKYMTKYTLKRSDAENLLMINSSKRRVKPNNFSF